MAAERIEITGIPEERVVAALFNASRPFGMGAYEWKDRKMEEAEAVSIINDHRSSPFGQRGDRRNFYLDYVEGRCIKCQFVHEGDRTYVESELHDRDYGTGATRKVIDALMTETPGAMPPVENDEPPPPTSPVSEETNVAPPVTEEPFTMDENGNVKPAEPLMRRQTPKPDSPVPQPMAPRAMRSYDAPAQDARDKDEVPAPSSPEDGRGVPEQPDELPPDEDAFKVRDSDLKEREEQFKVHERGRSRGRDVMGFFRKKN